MPDFESLQFVEPGPPGRKIAGLGRGAGRAAHGVVEDEVVLLV